MLGYKKTKSNVALTSSLTPLSQREMEKTYPVATAPGTDRNASERSFSLQHSLMHVDRQQINHREHEHPDEIDEVPIQTTDLNIFMIQFLRTGRDHQ